MAKILVYVPEDLHNALKTRRERTGCTTSVYIRHIVRKVLAGEGYFQSSASAPAAKADSARA